MFYIYYKISDVYDFFDLIFNIKALLNINEDINKKGTLIKDYMIKYIEKEMNNSKNDFIHGLIYIHHEVDNIGKNNKLEINFNVKPMIPFKAPLLNNNRPSYYTMDTIYTNCDDNNNSTAYRATHCHCPYCFNHFQSVRYKPY